MVGIIATVLLFLAVLCVLVLIHELGHFVAARIFGIHVEEFGFGFPPRVWGIKRGPTLYSINALPLGGFVKLKGEDGTGTLSQDKDSFASRPWWQKLIVLAAGVFMNVVLTIVLFTVGYAIGMPHILDAEKLDGQARDAKIQITYIQQGSPAQKAGLAIGDVISQLDGVAQTSIQDVQDYTRAHVEQSVTVTYIRGNSVSTQQITPVILKETGKAGIGIGIARIGLVSYPLHIAFIKSLETTWGIAVMIVSTLGSALRHLAFDNFVGPVGIASYTGTVAQLGITYLINLVGQLSMSLAIFNFLPIPALDGGRALFILIERVRRKSLNPAFENAIHVAGFMLLIALLILITIRDVTRMLPM
ncbi:MAG: M50 family metallopeptidase [Patescibacteria group bacterium]